VRAFARLYTALDETTATGEKIAALVEYFRAAPPEDAAWAVHFFVGRRPKRLVSAPALRSWAAAEAGIPDWLFEESHAAVGDLAETITLLLPDTGASSDRPLSWWVEERLLRLRGQDEAVQRANDTEYGLVAYVYTQDLRKGMRVSEKLDFGMIGLNRGLVSDPAAPFGGMKQSGLGREGAHEGLMEFLETQYVSVNW